jgi:HSP20 family protein
MPSQIAPQAGEKASTDKPAIVKAENLFDRVKKVTQAIANRAYEFFENGGRRFGQDLDDWLRAELELLRPIPVEISETDAGLKVLAEVPGFSASDIKISVEPQRIIISGKTEKSTEEKKEKTVYTERYSNEILRSLDLPAKVDPAKTTATLKDGLLEILAAKAEASKPVDVEVKAG